MFRRIANWIDQKGVRATFAGVAILSTILLGPFALILVAAGPREPWLFLLGLAGIAGLFGGGVRIWLGSRFFAQPRWVRVTGVALIAVGVIVAFLAALALPGTVYWTTVAPLVGIAGLVLLAGSISGVGPGPDYSSKPTPLRGAG